MTTKLSKLALGKIISDEEIYPRDRVEEDNVRSLVRALEAGVVLPPLAVDEKTKTLIDGEHRKRAHVRHRKDPAAEVDVEFVKCASRAEMFLEAMRRNANHGKRLTSYDIATIALRADSFRLSIDRCAEALHMTVEAYSRLTVDRFAETKPTKTAKAGPIPLKRTIRHLAGEALTKTEAETNTRLSGMNARFYVRQVLALLETRRLLQWDDPELVADLVTLHDRLGKCLDRYITKAS